MWTMEDVVRQAATENVKLLCREAAAIATITRGEKADSERVVELIWNCV